MHMHKSNIFLRHLLLLSALLSLSVSTIAQADSLKRALASAQHDTTRIIIYGRLANTPGQALDKCVAYADSALILAESVSDKTYLGHAVKTKGEIFSSRGYPDSAAFYFEQAINIYTLTGTWPVLGMTYYSLGNAYSTLDKNDLAQKAYMDGAKMSHTHNLLRSEAYCTNGLATIHFKLKNYPEAERTHLEALKMAEELGDPKLTGWVYTGLGNTVISTKNYDEALTYFSNALDSYTAANYLPGIAGAHNNIGVVYSFTEEFDKAIFHYRIAAATKHNYGELNGESTALSNISQLFVLMKQPDSAIFYANASLKIALNLSSLRHKQMAFGYVADAYALAEKYDSAYKYEVLFREYSDSLFDNSLSEQISEMQAKYDSEKQQQQIALLEKNNEIGQLWNYFFGASGGLVAVIALFMFMGYRSKKRANIILETQNHQITEQKKEITDSINYAKKIQQALLASGSLISKHIREYFILYKPKDIVSGDFYWATETKGNIDEFWFAVCDSTGHGVPGAFMSLLNTTFLSEAINEKKIENPGDVFDFTRKKLIDHLSQADNEGESRSDGMDGILVKIAGDKLFYSSANGSGILIRNEEAIELEADKMPVGRSPRENEKFTTHKLSINRGDRIYLFTDGYADQFGGDKGKKFKYKNLVNLILQHSAQPAAAQKKLLDANHNTWKGNLEQIDDILVVGLFF